MPALTFHASVHQRNFLSQVEHIRLGWIVIVTSVSMFFLYFPEEGGMVLPKGLPYDPQLVKPKAGAKGSDELDFNAPKEGTTKVVTVTIEGVPTSTRTASTA